MRTFRARPCLTALVSPSWTARYINRATESSLASSLSESSSPTTATASPVPRNDSAMSSSAATPRAPASRTGLRARTHVRISSSASPVVSRAVAISSQACSVSVHRIRSANSRLIDTTVSRCPIPSCSSRALLARSSESSNSFSMSEACRNRSIIRWSSSKTPASGKPEPEFRQQEALPFGDAVWWSSGGPSRTLGGAGAPADDRVAEGRMIRGSAHRGPEVAGDC